MRSNYIEVLSNKVEIPIIQRDYVQGRTDSKTNKIRKDFLDALFDFVSHKLTDKNAQIELDFIYGFSEVESDNKTTFVPIDGQQRLTTLWLLYWFVSVKENVLENEINFLSNFLYETRHSTTEFFRNLIQFKPKFSHEKISQEIKNQSWYFETWDFDPSIQAMLIVLDDIELRYENFNTKDIWSAIGNSSCPFYFYKLDMDKVGLTDDLYIKMNSRGKPLTEFEYFKAGFAEIISDSKQRKRFEESIDGKWIDAVWHIILHSGSLTDEDDIALTVDNSFLNLFNFITSVISFKNELKDKNDNRYKNTVISAELLKTIYSDKENQNFLFDTLDAICKQEQEYPQFWSDLFYYNKDEFATSKTRLFFNHKDTNLLKRCLFSFADFRGFTLPEQILLLACLTNLKMPSNIFNDQIRVVRNLVVNSENELRETTLGNSFSEVEEFVLSGNLQVLKTFKTDQIEEEKEKDAYFKQALADKEILQKLEDSDILRGSISLLPLDNKVKNRANKFLEIFDETDFIQDFQTKINLLLSFGDYTQDDGSLTNLMTSKHRNIRSFLTTPGYNKSQFKTKTQTIVLACLDYFITNNGVAISQQIEDNFLEYTTNPKDWKYYFLKYSSFRENCNQGNFNWYSDSDYCIWKMKERQFNGYHWDPFLYELSKSNTKLEFENNYGSKLVFLLNRKKILISSIPNGFLFENGMTDRSLNTLLDELVSIGKIDNDCKFIISQNSNKLDTEDRIEKLQQTLNGIINGQND
ncbi:DUF262 domain-containing protein [Flavobacterium degerlachei]|uniref:GmrSD restriction endonucleases N-terminal domain-containing protein n=1 Tax=Flavobacterium degerlachei TaxID=229203 RepID=A0A1H2UGW1_9FLAO|nr:DUF262 domain-containing protein [Flavobacterium degerlachei]SDW55371.1 Protein of unknown function DUF262 [Flavobacterium degerlachei]